LIQYIMSISESEVENDENVCENVAVSIPVAPSQLKEDLVTKLPCSQSLMAQDESFLPKDDTKSILVKSSDDTYAAQREALLRQKSLDDADSYAQTLFQGASFKKYGSMGNGKPKFLVCSQDGSLFWSDLSGGKTLSHVRLVNVTAVHKGKVTENFKRKVAKAEPEELCFSIVTREKTIDLVAESESVRDQWVRAILYASENVQTLGKVLRHPISTSGQERKERELERKINDLQAQLSQTKQTIFLKTQEVLKREQQIVFERQGSKQQLLEKDTEVLKLKEETTKLQAQQEELNQAIKKIHHERQVSRQERMAMVEAASAEAKRIEQEKKELEEHAAKEKEQMGSIINESQKLLSKAKETIHKRQQSRAQRVAVIDSLQKEIDELRTRNLELRTEVRVANEARARAEQDAEKARKIIAIIAQNSNLSAAFAQLDVDLHLSKPSDGSAAIASSPVSAPDECQRLETINEEKIVTVAEEVSISRPVASFNEVLEPALWKPDSSSRECLSCHRPFTFFNRRHHCRKCGDLICDDCSKARMFVTSTQKNVRVCRSCVSIVSTPMPGSSPVPGHLHRHLNSKGSVGEDD